MPQHALAADARDEPTIAGVARVVSSWFKAVPENRCVNSAFSAAGSNASWAMAEYETLNFPALINLFFDILIARWASLRQRRRWQPRTKSERQCAMISTLWARL